MVVVVEASFLADTLLKMTNIIQTYPKKLWDKSYFSFFAIMVPIGVSVRRAAITFIKLTCLLIVFCITITITNPLLNATCSCSCSSCCGCSCSCCGCCSRSGRSSSTTCIRCSFSGKNGDQTEVLAQNYENLPGMHHVWPDLATLAMWA